MNLTFLSKMNNALKIKNLKDNEHETIQGLINHNLD